MYLEERKTERIREGIGIKFRRVNTVIKPPMANLLWLQPMNENVYGCTLKMHPGEKCNKKKNHISKPAHMHWEDPCLIYASVYVLVLTIISPSNFKLFFFYPSSVGWAVRIHLQVLVRQ